MRIALAQINPIVGDFKYNRDKIIHYIGAARKQKADMVLFSELALCGYPPEDLLYLPRFVEASEKELAHVIEASQNIIVIVGMVRKNPLRGEKSLLNSAAIIENRTLLGFQDKTLLPDYDVFSESRYFESSTKNEVWILKGKRVGVTICEDLWQHADAVEYAHYMRDPVLELQKQKPDLLVNLSSSPFFMRRQKTRLHVCAAAAKTLKCPILFCNQVGGNDSLIFDGNSLYVSREGELLQQGKGFEEDLLVVDTEAKTPPITLADNAIEDLWKALVLGLRDYFYKLGFQRACLGLSGGIDSCVVCCLAVEALGRENVLALGMPSRYSSESSVEDSVTLAHNLGIDFKEISIEKPFQAYLDILEPQFKGRKLDITEENLQARVRGMILMAFSNKFGYLVLGTGNKSELAMGYCTLYGDMCGGLAVLNDVTKQQVYALGRWINRQREFIPEAVFDKPPSAELRPDQKDTDSLPDYEIVDLVLEQYIEEHRSPEEIASKNGLALSLVKGLVRKIHASEYKRRQSPPGLRVTKRAFSIGRRFPIVHHWEVD